MKNYDVIVIGAGNGGRAAAANCAKAGLSTLLLERHNIPGGSASSFVRDLLNDRIWPEVVLWPPKEANSIALRMLICTCRFL